jgi:hypothetical protein
MTLRVDDIHSVHLELNAVATSNADQVDTHEYYFGAVKQSVDHPALSTNYVIMTTCRA